MTKEKGREGCKNGRDDEGRGDWGEKPVLDVIRVWKVRPDSPERCTRSPDGRVYAWLSCKRAACLALAYSARGLLFQRETAFRQARGNMPETRLRIYRVHPSSQLFHQVPDNPPSSGQVFNYGPCLTVQPPNPITFIVYLLRPTKPIFSSKQHPKLR